tara:strand:- start:75070 stop:75198 length:129 start_codon:yes stop_codon:yes gene_type:complete
MKEFRPLDEESASFTKSKKEAQKVIYPIILIDIKVYLRFITN